jgi:hypothetical protein
VFLINSRSHRLPATSERSGSKSHHLPRHTFSRSYGINLQSSLTRVLSSALGFSPHPPVSVYGTVQYCLKLRGFSREHGIWHFGARSSSSSRLGIDPPDLPGGSSYTLKLGHPSCHSLLRHPIAAAPGTGMLTCFPSTTPFGLALGTDSPCAD